MQKYHAEIRRLDELHAELDELWTKVPRYGLLALLAPVVWYFWGAGWAIAELLVTAALTGTQAYLIGVRKTENRWNREMLVEDIRRMEEAPGAGSGEAAARGRSHPKGPP